MLRGARRGNPVSEQRMATRGRLYSHTLMWTPLVVIPTSVGWSVVEWTGLSYGFNPFPLLSYCLW
jgi:hypothetical protein